MIVLKSFRLHLLILLAPGINACSGLVAGPVSSSVTAIPASRDSAYVRARRALQAESFTLDKIDSTHGVLTGTRWPISSAKQGSSAACHVALVMNIKGSGEAAEVTSTSRWIAPEGMNEQAPKVCEQERSQVLERTAQVLVPPATP
jgi:hypothetical protein